MKKVSTLSIGILLLSFITIGLFLVGSSGNKAYAYGRGGEMQRFSLNHSGGMMGMENMMRGEDRPKMINMMRDHHGENWQDHHNNIM